MAMMAMTTNSSISVNPRLRPAKKPTPRRKTARVLSMHSITTGPRVLIEEGCHITVVTTTDFRHELRRLRFEVRDVANAPSQHNSDAAGFSDPVFAFIRVRAVVC